MHSLSLRHPYDAEPYRAAELRRAAAEEGRARDLVDERRRREQRDRLEGQVKRWRDRWVRAA